MADRFDEILAQMREDRAAADRDRAAWGERIDRLQNQTDDNLRFLSEMNRRAELVFQELVREGRAMREESRAMRAEIRAETVKIEESTAQLRVLNEATKAHTRAIFALIDRLEGGGVLKPAT